uniref:Protein MMS22-like n=1 Tax=Crassostrea virginica TaxID=6565 RepID=A0A8B8EQX0_CRAVI|nr:protein MMS22-like [Crassostrea virginica]XP_022342344.1 protein MMS22-like [Crassostrea virginica]
MEFEDSESFFPLISEENILMTPPRESESDQLMDIEFAVPFECSTCKNNTTELRRYLKCVSNESVPLIPHTMELFDQVFVWSDLLQKNKHSSFMMMRQWMNIINSIDNTSEMKNKLEYRQDVVKFLEFIKYIVASNGADRDICEGLTNEVYGLFLYCDRLSEFDRDISMLGEHESSCFHGCLDVYVGVLKILHAVEIKSADSPESCFQRKTLKQSVCRSSASSFISMVHLMVWELVALAKNMYKMIPLHDLQTRSPFPCPCVLEVWKLVKMMMDHVHQRNRGEESFYVLLFDIINRILQDPEPQDEEMESDFYECPPRSVFDDENGEFCLWLLVHMSKMAAAHSMPQNFDLKVTEIASTVVKFCLSKERMTEGQLRFLVAMCQDLPMDTRATILNLLWEYFYKKMNSNFSFNTKSIDSVRTLCKSAGQHLELCSRVSRGECKVDDNSYIRFLSLLCHTLQDKGSLSSEWKQMKGRIFSKFHIRRMQELTETGLHNFFCLFLSLAITADTEEIITRMCKYCDMIWGSEDLGVRVSLMRGMFAATLLYIQRNISVQALAEKLVGIFNRAASDLGRDEMRRHSHWTIVCSYLEHVAEVFERSTDVEMSQHVLIGEGLGKLLDVCRTSEINGVVITVQEILSKFRDIIRRGFVMTAANSAMYSALMTNLTPPLKSLCCSQTAPQACADLLATLCLVSIDCKSEDFVAIFKFSISESVNKSVSSRFLSQVLSVDGFLQQLSEHFPSYDVALIQAWLTSSILVPQSPLRLRDFLQVPAVRELFTVSGMEPPEDGQIIHFIQAIKKTYDKTTGWKERICLRDKVMLYFVDIHKQIAPVLQTLQPADVLRNVYAVLGYLVKHCAPVLFVQSKPDCPLPNILTTLIVPHFMFNAEKPPKSAFINIVGQHLHQFVIGLSKLEYRRATYVNRKLGDIVSIYLPKYWSSSLGPARQHPLVLALKSSFIKDPSETDIAFRHFLLELVCEKYLQFSQQAYNPNHQYAIKFLTEVVKHTAEPKVVESDCRIVLYSILRVDLLTPSQQSELLLQSVMESVCLSQQNTDISNICSILSKFITDHKKGHLEAVFNTLHKLPPKCGPYISQVSSQLQHCLIENESFRGVGRDNAVRSKYYNLMKYFNIGS